MNMLLAVLLAAAPAVRAAEPASEVELRQKEAEARGAVDDYRRSHEAAEESRRRYQSLQRLQRDLDYIATELERELLAEEKTLRGVSEGCLARIEYLKAHGRLDPRLYDPAEQPPDADKPLARLETMCRELPAKTYAEQYPGSLMRGIAAELREAAKLGDEAAILDLLRADLVLPDLDAGEEDAFSSLALFPVDLPLAKFKKLGAIRIFLVKHRIRRPKTHAKTSAAAIVAGKHNVQVGVEVEGVVNRASGEVDLDYTFDIGNLHIEMTPEWRLAHPGILKPKKGQRIRVRGWTYYDYFHKAEPEYDPSDPVLGLARKTLWEIHPVQDVELLP